MRLYRTDGCRPHPVFRERQLRGSSLVLREPHEVSRSASILLVLIRNVLDVGVACSANDAVAHTNLDVSGPFFIGDAEEIRAPVRSRRSPK